MLELTYTTYSKQKYIERAIDAAYIYTMFTQVIQAIDCESATVINGFTGEVQLAWYRGKFEIINGIFVN